MSPSPRTHPILALIFWLLLTFAAGAVGAVFSAESGAFYAQLDQPAWAPPAWLFGPVWTVLYVLMGIAAWLVWRAPSSPRRSAALGLFVVQLAANPLWTWLFFSLHRGGAAFVEIVVLWLLIAGTVFLFARVHRLAAGLLLPYWAWATFAAGLNFTLWRMNPVLLGA